VTLRLDYRTLIEPVTERARRDPDCPSVVLIGEDGSEETVSAAQFLASAADYAAALRAAGIRPRDIVILVMRHSKELLSALWGSLYLGAIPSIFPFLSEKLDRSLYMQQVRILVAHCRARAVIAFPEFKPDLAALLEGVDCQVFATDEVRRRTAAEAPPPPHQAAPDTVALLQHSSGSTGLQKGVALSHRAILNQVRSCGQAVALCESDVIVSWMPLYHDGGLIAGCIMPLVAGVPLVLISPFHWVRDPKVLFQAVHRHRGTLTWLPNFAYNHCARNVRDRDLVGVDLSRWRLVNAAEPARWDSHRLFVERFGRYGFKESALAVGYGMAEATLIVTATPVGESPHVDWVETRALQERLAVPAVPEAAGSTPMTSCGFPVEGAEIGIVDDEGRRLPERRVGEIVVRASSLFSGYYLRPDLDAKVLRDGWYFTGDMGYLATGQLYVSGRKDDLIIVGGKNIYPNDLEAIANEVPGVRPGRAVAFGVPDPRLGTDEVVMVCELSGSAGLEETRRIELELRRRIAQQTEVTLHDVRLMHGPWLIKTSSGKLARAANREKYLREHGRP